MLAASLLLLTPISRADEGEAETLIGQGVALRQLGRDQEALQLFRRAFAQAPSPALPRAETRSTTAAKTAP